MANITLYQGDCLEEMKKIPDHSVDLILCDLPYGNGNTVCKWDTCINLEALWGEYKRIIKENGPILLFGDGGKFTAQLIESNEKLFKYNWYWQKTTPRGFLQAHIMPMKTVETISVFYKKKPMYNPQMTPGKPYITKRDSKRLKNHECSYDVKGTDTVNTTGDRFPTQVLTFKPESHTVHPTQKPVALLEYFIKTYTTEGMTVLDNTMGSGSTGVAAKNLNRNFIGIELDENYFNIAKKRIEGGNEAKS